MRITIDTDELPLPGDNVSAKLNALIVGLENLRMLTEETRAMLNELTASVARVSARIDGLQAAGQAVAAATEGEFRAALQPIADQLNVLANPGTA